MWFNGTSLSEKARRALENEKVTIVSHISGYVHTLYKEATIDRKAYDYFSEKLREFLTTGLTSLIFINFLRFKSKYKILFQFECECSGKKRYISLDKLFEYEHTSKFNASPESRAQLIREIEGEEFDLSPLHGKILLNEVEDLLDSNQWKNLGDIEIALTRIIGHLPAETISEMFNDLSQFISTDPKIPQNGKEYSTPAVPSISTSDSRHEIIASIVGSVTNSELSLLTLYVYRQMDRIDWLPFIKAAIERNPVCLNDLNDKSISDIHVILSALPNHSIYDDKRLAQPDEVWNFSRGDGIEKALLLAGIIINRDKGAEVKIIIDQKKVSVEYNQNIFEFESSKHFKKFIRISGDGVVILKQYP
jgi:hypothetical protein